MSERFTNPLFPDRIARMVERRYRNSLAAHVRTMSTDDDGPASRLRPSTSLRPTVEDGCFNTPGGRSGCPANHPGAVGSGSLPGAICVEVSLES
jgi:hypothetical protein